MFESKMSRPLTPEQLLGGVRGAHPAGLVAPGQTLIDVLVIYGSNFLSQTSLDGIRLRAELGIEYINYSLQNSGAGEIRLRLVGVRPSGLYRSA